MYLWTKGETLSHSGAGMGIENEGSSDRQQLHGGFKGRQIKIKAGCN